MMCRIAYLLVVCCLFALNPQGCRAVEISAYPTHAVTLIAPFAAGGDADLSARNLAQAVTATLGQSVVVVNKAGASGALGTHTARDANPDGYTLLLARIGSQSILPALKTGVGYLPADFTYLGLLELNPVVCVVNADSSIKQFSDLIRALRDKPGKLNYSSAGVGSIQQLGPQLLFQLLQLSPDQATHVSYKGGSEAVVAVMSHQVDFSCGNLSSSLNHIQSGALRALVTTTTSRLIDLPDIPTARELGYPQLEQIVGWSALAGPANMDKIATNRWVSLLSDLHQNQSWLNANATYGGVPHLLSPEQTRQFVMDQYDLYQRLGQQLNINLN